MELPTTRYQGSKRKIADLIYQVTKDIEFNSVLDLFGGTGIVSYLFKSMGKTVYYNDVLKFNYLIGKALIENDNITVSKEDIKYLTSNHIEAKYLNTVSKFYKDIYYLDHENEWLDRIMSNLAYYKAKNDNYDEFKEAVVKYALFQSCIIKRPFNLFHRKNLYLRLNDVERTFGNKKTWDRDFDYYLNTFINEANRFIFQGDKKCYSLNYSFDEIDLFDFELIYIDPPYLNTGSGKNESSDYFKCYHFLEGLSNWEKWEQMIDFNTKNNRLKVNDNVNYFNKANIHQSVQEIIGKYHDKIILFSYKSGGIPSIKFIVETIQKYKKTVKIFEKKYVYALNKQNGNAEKNREVLILGIG